VTRRRETIYTVPTAITAVRTVGCVVLGLTGITQESMPLLLWALGVYWLGDVLDGAVARWLDRETRTGAVADIVADRLCAAVCYLGLLIERPEMAVPIGIYLVNFMLVDALLSLSFLSWPLTSPNYFSLVDPTVWRWNWSRPGKALNSSLLAILIVATDAVMIATALAAALLVVKIASLVRVERLPQAPLIGCAAAAHTPARPRADRAPVAGAPLA
jgi:CDP-diacylglycerol--glycerol-3-phosphate 3-phosphatidyltransferase